MESYLKDQHEYTEKELYEGVREFEHEFEVKETPVYEVGKDDNVWSQNHKLHLEKDGIQLTRDYWNIIELWDDHYVVCDLTASGCYLDDINEYTMEREIEALQPTIKFQVGVIKLQRNKEGKVIPFAEKTIVPIMYDRISENNDDSLTAYINGKLTYIDLNPKSSNYGKQIVPAILEHAVPFNVDYDGFAECSVDGITGYLPRNCNPREQLNSSDLLTEEQVQYLLQKDDTLDSSSTNKLSELTGSAKVLKRTRK